MYKYSTYQIPNSFVFSDQFTAYQLNEILPIPPSPHTALLFELLQGLPEREHRVGRRRESELPVLVQALLLFEEIQTQTGIKDNRLL